MSDNDVLSTESSVKLLLSTFLTAQAALRRDGENITTTTPGPVFHHQDKHFNTYYRWLEYALDELRANDKRAYIGVWLTYVLEEPTDSEVRKRNAHRGLKAIINSVYRPSYVRVPEELNMRPRRSTLNGKKEQNRDIREMYAQGMTQQAIADIYGISQRQVSTIVRPA